MSLIAQKQRLDALNATLKSLSVYVSELSKKEEKKRIFYFAPGGHGEHVPDQAWVEGHTSTGW